MIAIKIRCETLVDTIARLHNYKFRSINLEYEKYNTNRMTLVKKMKFSSFKSKFLWILQANLERFGYRLKVRLVIVLLVKEFFTRVVNEWSELYFKVFWSYFFMNLIVKSELLTLYAAVRVKWGFISRNFVSVDSIDYTLIWIHCNLNYHILLPIVGQPRGHILIPISLFLIFFSLQIHSTYLTVLIELKTYSD